MNTGIPAPITGPECLECHQSLTPGILNDWKASRHAAPSSGAAPVTCDACHGNDHQALTFPTPATCGTCHEQQHGAFLAEKRYGFPSHALAMERAVDRQAFRRQAQGGNHRLPAMPFGGHQVRFLPHPPPFRPRRGPGRGRKRA